LAAYFFNKARGGQQFHLRFLAWAQKKITGHIPGSSKRFRLSRVSLASLPRRKGQESYGRRECLVWSGLDQVGSGAHPEKR
jgi:hypothetical protein